VKIKSSSMWVRRAAVVLVLVTAVVGLFAWLSVRGACNVEAVGKGSALLLHQMDRFDHSYQFATSAAPDAIVRPVAELQRILMDTQGMDVPGCLQEGKKELTDYMLTVIYAFEAYGLQEQDSLRELVRQSDTHYEQFHVEIEEVRACAPWCFR
jgi:hypothetical protein